MTESNEKLNLPKHIYLEPKHRGNKINKKPYSGQFTYKNTLYYCGNFETIKEAQISVDKKRLSLGLEPLLLKKQNG